MQIPLEDAGIEETGPDRVIPRRLSGGGGWRSEGMKSLKFTEFLELGRDSNTKARSTTKDRFHNT
jgi:hypothetical protein